jgi:hypothetical protein
VHGGSVAYCFGQGARPRMRPDHRQKTLDWATWYRANRPRHEGSADVQRQLAFTLRALDGVYTLLLLLAADTVREQAEAERSVLVQLPRLERTG